MQTLHLLVLNVVGFVFLGLGLAKAFGGVDFIPIQFQFQHYELTFIAGGIVLMVPAFINIVRKLKEGARANSEPKLIEKHHNTEAAKPVLFELLALRNAPDRLAVLAATVLMAVALVLVRGIEKVRGDEVIIFLLFYFLCYYPATAVALRSAKLHGFLRYVFCLTALPLFGSLLVASVVWLFGEFPLLSDGYSRAWEAGGRRPGMAYGVLVAIIAGVAFWLWYKALCLLDAFLYQK